ncbi:MAG TPA: DUF1343 domain-containing protein [Fimbriimonas sp.]|nr:DUF1343 domain-containing protein [Fimbriimonas sp.]
MQICTGLDHYSQDQFAALKGKRVGVLCNQASVNWRFDHILDLMRWCAVDLRVIFSPQHGLFGTTQDNMIEWSPVGEEEIPIISLYSETRQPTQEMLSGLDVLVIDLPDIGSRYYTFAWTTVLTMRTAAAVGVKVIILDRPNPIGRQTEGAILQPGYESFVGMLPIAQRHGLTLGEIARLERLLNTPNVDLEVVTSKSEEANWVMPSPNMPTRDTALVYPGACLIEGTNLSEGRGTTRPFEIVGAPWIKRELFATALNEMALPGVVFRPIQFQPTFNKYSGKVCDGVFVHVTDAAVFRPVLSYCAVMQMAIDQTGLHTATDPQPDSFTPECSETKLGGFAWRRPPYEYEFEKLPIDILFGNSWCREALVQQTNLDFLTFSWLRELEAVTDSIEQCKID